MSRKKKTASSSAPLLDVRVTTTPCVPAVRDKVMRWRDADYPGATETSRRLLHHWFLTDNRCRAGNVRA